MRILIDENVHAQVARGLVDAGQDVVWIARSHPGASDAQILGRKDIGECFLVTYDRDFGELIFKEGLAVPLGVIYSRIGRSDPEALVERIQQIIMSEEGLGKFIVIERDGERARSLPEKRQR